MDLQIKDASTSGMHYFQIIFKITKLIFKISQRWYFSTEYHLWLSYHVKTDFLKIIFTERNVCEHLYTQFRDCTLNSKQTILLGIWEMDINFVQNNCIKTDFKEFPYIVRNVLWYLWIPVEVLLGQYTLKIMQLISHNI